MREKTSDQNANSLWKVAIEYDPRERMFRWNVWPLPLPIEEWFGVGLEQTRANAAAKADAHIMSMERELAMPRPTTVDVYYR